MEYEKYISLKYIYLPFKRHWKNILFTLFLFIIFGIIFVNFIYVKQYTSYGSLRKNTYFNAVQADQYVSETISSDSTISSYYERLIENDIRHSNGSELTKSEIKNSIILPSTGVKELYTISFKNSDQAIISKSLSVILDETVSILLNKYPSEMGGLKVDTYPQSVSLVSNGNHFYAIFPTVGLVGIYLIYFGLEVYYEKIDSKKDLEFTNKKIYVLNLPKWK